MSTSETQRSKSRPHLPALTGLRALAAVWVVLLHFRGDFLLLLPATAVVAPFIRKGYYAVDLFFVLSGFILAYTYFDTYRGTGRDYRTFLSHRLARIYPVHVFTLALLLFLLVSARISHAHISDSRYDVRSFLDNVLLIHSWGLEDWDTWNQPSWSLSAEWFAYVFVFPSAWLVLKRITRPRHVFALILVSIAILLAWSQFTSDDNLARFAVRVTCEFFAGACVYVLYTQWKATADWILIPSIVIGLCLTYYLPENNFWLNPLMFGFFAVLVFGLARAQGFMAAILGSRALVYAGEASFSLYMIHGILQKIFKIALPAAHFAHSSQAMRLGVLLVYLAGLGVSAVLTYTYIEKPARQKVRRALESKHDMKRVSAVAVDLAPAK